VLRAYMDGFKATLDDIQANVRALRNGR
jgi:hypothetical protein